jgi:hypothetical protein
MVPLAPAPVAHGGGVGVWGALQLEGRLAALLHVRQVPGGFVLFGFGSVFMRYLLWFALLFALLCLGFLALLH